MEKTKQTSVIYTMKEKAYKEHLERLKTDSPIRKGCENEKCFCTGACYEIIGWRPKTVEELRNSKQKE